MRGFLAAFAIAFVSAGLAPTQASPVAPASMASAVDQFGGVETIHCTPGKRHHIPTWNYQADGCRRPSKKKAPAKAPAKAPPPKSSQ